MNSEINSEVERVLYSVRKLAEMRLPGYPGTERAWLDLVKKENWSYKEFRGNGRGGLRREYVPPPEIKALIEARQRGEQPPRPAPPDKHYSPQAETPHSHLRVAEDAPHYHSRDLTILRMAITLTEEASAVQTFSVDQRAELILTFYNRLSKQPEK